MRGCSMHGPLLPPILAEKLQPVMLSQSQSLPLLSSSLWSPTTNYLQSEGITKPAFLSISFTISLDIKEY
jgi:hypothetical protein